MKRRETWSYTNGIHEKNAVNWASNHAYTIMVEGCRNYIGKVDTFQEWHTRDGGGWERLRGEILTC
jgi:hypothetical protein